MRSRARSLILGLVRPNAMSRLVATLLLVTSLVFARADAPTKRIVVQLRHDTGEIVSVSVLPASSSDGALAVTQFAQRAVPDGVAPRAEFWYVAGMFRLSEWKARDRSFAEVPDGGRLAMSG